MHAWMDGGILGDPQRVDFGKTSTGVSDFIVGSRVFSQQAGYYS